MSEKDRVKGFLVGTGKDPLGVAVDIEVEEGGVSTRVDPMVGTSRKKPLVSKHPAVTSYVKEVVVRVRAESYRNRTITSNFKAKRKPGVRGEWVECPTCHARNSTDCETCWERGAVWKSY